MRNLVINCNVSVKESFDEEKVKDAFMSLFIVTVNSDIKINGFRINNIDDSVLEQIPPLPKEHLGWEAPDRSEILAIDKDYVLMRQDTLDRLLDYTHSQPLVYTVVRCEKQNHKKASGCCVGAIIL